MEIPLKEETVKYLTEMFYDRYVSKSNGEERAKQEARVILKKTYGEDEESINMWIEYFAEQTELIIKGEM